MEVDIQKGAAQVGRNLLFHVNDTEGTASKSMHTMHTRWLPPVAMIHHELMH